MKQSNRDKALEELMRSSVLAAGGFMGDDVRSVFEIIEADSHTLSRMGVTKEQLAERMCQVTNVALAGLGTWVRIDDNLEAKIDEAQGKLTCPWPHPGGFAKRITTVRQIATKRIIYWSDLNTHLIAEHGFFEGKGSNFRVEPGTLIEIIL